MMGDEWPYLTRGRKIMLILALVSLGYLLLQMRQGPAELSNWSGNSNPFAASAAGAPVYATHNGVVQLARDTYPAGNHIWVIGAHFKTGYSHLKDFAVQDGQAVKRGDVIGYVGSTGEASGPHLDYQVWQDGANVNPLDYGA